MTYTNEDVQVMLDVDDVDGYGPETTKVFPITRKGNYQFYVHDYSNGGELSSSEMSLSDAIVKVYLGQVLKHTISIPKNQIGTFWRVFDYDAATQTIKDNVLRSLQYKITP